MATFVKLTNGDIVNIQHIKSIKRHEYASAGELASFFMGKEFGEIPESERLQTVPSIEIQLGNDPKSLILKYGSEQERDAEFGRIEGILFPNQKPLFKNLLLNPELIQSMLVEWSGHSDDTLKLRIKVAGTASFVIFVRKSDAEEWTRAQDLIAQLGLSLPQTMREYMQEKRKQGFGTL